MSTNPQAPTTRTPMPPPARRQPDSLPSIYIAIEYNLPPNFAREYHPRHGYRWITYSRKTGFSARVYPHKRKDMINISVFDDTGELIKKWSTDIMIVSEWRRRLRQAAGEALVLANQRPKCPNPECKKPLILRERREDQEQFFGCPDFPTCLGTITITDHDIDREKKAGS